MSEAKSIETLTAFWDFRIVAGEHFLIPKECKRLAEVDFPIAVVSKHSAREKSIRHGHPSTLHLWWARRPLAACRAMLLGLLLPDPCDSHCPADFKNKARELLPKVQGIVGPESEDLRQALLKFIGDFSNWALSTNQTYLEVGRGLVKAAHPEETPLVVDPFAGGGSIPLEALRLGCETFASDLNPVACLILKVMLEDIPRYGPELADELRRVGKEIKKAAEKELADFYPSDPDGSKPIAYLWARTVHCESPNCGMEIPLMRSLWLSKKVNRKRALRYHVIRQNGHEPRIELKVFEPNEDQEVVAGTVNRSKGICPACGSVLARERVQAQMKEANGGADNARLIAVVTRHPEGRKDYRTPISNDYTCLKYASERLAALEKKNAERYIIDAELPYLRSIFNVHVYGVNTWGKLFNIRQRLALLTFSDIVLRFKVWSNPEDRILRQLLGLCVSRMADYLSSVCRWDLTQERAVNTFCRQALGMVWDYAEIVPITHTVGSWDSMFNSIIRVLEFLMPLRGKTGTVAQVSATDLPLPDDSTDIVFTDPPYYDAVPYANLSDFFIVWLTKTLDTGWSPRLEDGLAPKSQEIVQLAERNKLHRHKTKQFFEAQMKQAFSHTRNTLKKGGISCVVFAHKDTESWEALVGALIEAGWKTVSSWPLQTEQSQRLRARDSAALATSVHLVCRPRPEDAPVGDWGEVLRELPKKVGDWMERLQLEGIRGADLVFACIGPALEIFSRYSKVVDAEEREIPLGGDPEASEPHKRGFLSYVWEVVGRTALEHVLGTAEAKARNSTAGALEEDARLTALFLWTLQSTNGNGARKEQESDEEIEADEEDTGKDAGATKKKKGYSLIFDVVRRFAQPLGIHLPEWEGRIIETEKGVVRLFSVKERAKQLFGEESISVAGIRIEEQARRDPQMKFDFAIKSETGAPPQIKGHHKRKEKGLPAETAAKAVTTTLDRVHAAMLLQASGQTNALRTLLKAEVDRGADFIRLANALSALYPKQSEEKRLLDAMLLAIPR